MEIPSFIFFITANERKTTVALLHLVVENVCRQI